MPHSGPFDERLAASDVEVKTAYAHVSQWAEKHFLQTVDDLAKNHRAFVVPATGLTAAAFYTKTPEEDTRGLEVNLDDVRRRAGDDAADSLFRRLRALGYQGRGRQWPRVQYDTILQSWAALEQEVLDRVAGSLQDP